MPITQHVPPVHVAHKTGTSASTSEPSCPGLCCVRAAASHSRWTSQRLSRLKLTGPLQTDEQQLNQTNCTSTYLLTLLCKASSGRRLESICNRNGKYFEMKCDFMSNAMQHVENRSVPARQVSTHPLTGTSTGFGLAFVNAVCPRTPSTHEGG